MLDIRRQAEGLIDMSEDGLCAMSSSNRLEGLGITLIRSDIIVGQHANRSNNTSKVQTKCRMNR